jgi:hypothetical protein
MGWLTPDTIPSTTVCRQLLIPDNTLIVAAVNGALCRLAEAERWEQYGAVTPEEMAAAMIDVVGQYFISECNGGCEMSGCRTRRTETLDVTANTDTCVDFDAELWDDDDYHSLVTNTTRLTVPEDGRYLLTANAFWSFSTACILTLSIRLNGLDTIASTRKEVENSMYPRQAIATIWNAQKNNYFEMVVFHTCGGYTHDLLASRSFSPEFAIQKLSS